MWPNFKSPLLWDVFAVSIYGTVSAALLVRRACCPDLATLPRPRGHKAGRTLSGVRIMAFFSLGLDAAPTATGATYETGISAAGRA